MAGIVSNEETGQRFTEKLPPSHAATDLVRVMKLASMTFLRQAFDDFHCASAT